MARRQRTLTQADKQAAGKVRDLWEAFRKQNPGVSQEAAAQRIGMGQSAFSQFLRGEVPMRITPVLKFAKLFGVEPRAIRPDIDLIGDTRASTASEPAPAPYAGVSEEALEIARAFDQLQPQTKQRVREHVFLYAVIDKSFPWLRTGRPISDRYAAFEKWHLENRQAQLTLEAARIQKPAKDK